MNVLYGSGNGLTAEGNQLWTQDSPGVKDVAEPSDAFGLAVSSGDYNGDGFDDLTIGVPGEDFKGAVNVLYGSPSGLSAAGNQFWHQDSRGIEDVAEDGDAFGFALVSGDFNGDGFADLGVGVPFECLEGETEKVCLAGAVNVLYGSPAGLTAAGNQFWTQDSPRVKDVSEFGDQFGYALTAGDFNGDGFEDLAVGVPGETLEAVRFAGAVNVLYGSPSGLTAAGNEFWHQDRPGIRDVAEWADAFGIALTSRDYNHDGFSDLAAGVPYEDIRGIEDAGGVNVLYGSARGLSATGNQFWHRGSPGIKGKGQMGAFFGQSLSDSGSPR